ncbi:MAG: hypothetical protein ACYDHU_03410 [Acidimicrobiales bacterium]
MTGVKQFESIRRDHGLEQLSVRELARGHQVHRRVVRHTARRVWTRLEYVKKVLTAHATWAFVKPAQLWPAASGTD